VIGTARPDSHDFLAGLGAIPVAYGPGLAERVRGLGLGLPDLALDVAGAGSLEDLIAVTGDAGAVVTLADFTGAARGVRLSLGQYGGEPDGRRGLAIAAELSSQGRFRVPVQKAFPPARAAEAHATAAQGARQGKIALDLAGW
jgi:NADPH:quinone reductase-like Zn-dependent oxidoreductase